MGLFDIFKRLQNTTNEASSGAAANQTTLGAKDFKDLDFEKINRTIANTRWAYDNDDTVSSTIDASVMIALDGMTVVADSKEHDDAASYLNDKLREWKLQSLAEESLTDAMVDGTSFNQKYIKDGELQISKLLFDADKYDFRVIRNPETGMEEGYVQKALTYKPIGDWENKKYSELQSISDVGTETTYTFKADEIINFRYKERNGEGRSAIYPCIDNIYRKKKIEQYMLDAAYKARHFIGIEVGNEKVTNDKIEPTDIDAILSYFDEAEDKQSVSYGFGIKPEIIGDTSLPAYVDYLSYYKNSIRSTLQTPDTKFESVGANRATAKEQLSGDFGSVKYIGYLRNFVNSYYVNQLLEADLKLPQNRSLADSIGHVNIEYTKLSDEEMSNLADTAMKLKEIYPDADMDLLLKVYFEKFSKQVERLGLSVEAPDVMRLENTLDNDVKSVLLSRGLKGI